MLMIKRVRPHIIPAVIEHQNVPGFFHHRHPVWRGGRIGKTSSTAEGALEKLLDCLNELVEMSRINGLDPAIIGQLIRQVFSIFISICSEILDC